MKTVVIEGQLRNDFGKKASRDLRSQEMVPGVIYGGESAIHFYAPILAFRPIVYTPDFLTAEVKIGDKTYPCLLKDMQFDVVTDKLSHVDFQALIEDRKVIAQIPLKFKGNAAGVLAGGHFVPKMKYLKVRTFPKYLVENIEVDITDMKLNDNIRVEDVHREHLEIMNAPRQPIASVVLTRALKQEETAAKKEGATEAATPTTTDAAATASAASGKKK